MKKTLILGILGLAASAVTSFGQGSLALNNYHYSLTGPLQDVKYGAGSDGTVGAGLNSSYTVGVYYVSVAGDNHASFSADASGTALPTSLYTGPGTLTLAGLTGTFGDILAGFTPGEYAPANSFNPGLGGGATATIMVIAYEGSSYATASHRGHSAAFTMTTPSGSAATPLTGNSETDGGFSAFTVASVPEPSVLALSGLGAAALMALRRKKQA